MGLKKRIKETPYFKKLVYLCNDKAIQDGRASRNSKGITIYSKIKDNEEIFNPMRDLQYYLDYE